MNEQLHTGRQPAGGGEYKIPGLEGTFRKVNGKPQRVDKAPESAPDVQSREGATNVSSDERTVLSVPPTVEYARRQDSVEHEPTAEEPMAPPPPKHEATRSDEPTLETSQRKFSRGKMATIALLGAITLPGVSYGSNAAVTYAFTKGGETVGVSGHLTDFIEEYINTDEE